MTGCAVRGRLATGILAALLASLGGLLPSCGAESSEHTPATVDDAAKILDLSTLPLMEKAEQPQQQRLAGLTYKVAATVAQAFQFHRGQFAERKWEELPGSYASNESSSATFTRNRYVLSLTVFSIGADGAVTVTINQHGNVDLTKLPVPAGVKPFYGGPVSTAYITETAVEPTAQACRKLLMEKGWQTYGTAGDVQYFKQNAVRLSARVLSAPAQGGKTVIDYSTVLMSADLPAPADTERLQYSDDPTQISFDTKANLDKVVQFYRDALKAGSWKSTTEKLIRIDFRDELIFRNPRQEMITLEAQEVDGLIRVLLRFQTAAEVAELDRRAKEAVAKSQRKADQEKMEQNKPGSRLAVAIPLEAKDIQRSKSSIEFKLAAGKARGVVEAWRKQFAKEGWKEEVATLEDVAGALSLSKGKQSLTISYTDTGVLPAEIDLQAIGVEFEPAAAKKAK